MKAFSSEDIPVEILQVITPRQAWHYHIVPFQASADRLDFFINEDIYAEDTREELTFLFGKDVQLKPLSNSLLQQALSRYYRRSESSQQFDFEKGKDNFLEQLIAEAKELGASDIHIEPYEESCRVRFRIDGVLIEKYSLEKSRYPSIVNKIKINGNLDIAEKRLPQDGRIFFKQGNFDFDIRVSSLPTLHGEKIVMRLLSKNNSEIEIKQLGFRENDLKQYTETVKKKEGIILISGPTGSGKTTTLYATLSMLNNSERNILTIEDPIEYTLPGINQVQLKESIGLDFASAMRTFLRQDPDIIMVGEIRDVATASMAIRASLTGHLVLSTIHTNSAWGVVSRLIDMGVPSYLLADTLNMAVAQRLVRLLCRNCRIQKPFEGFLFPPKFKAAEKIENHYTAVGCPNCFYTGYRGRKAVYEIIPIDSELSDKIKNKDLNVRDSLREKGILSLSENAFELFKSGATSIEEVYPILSSSGE